MVDNFTNGLSPSAVKQFWQNRTHEDFMVKCNQTYVFENDTTTRSVMIEMVMFGHTTLVFSPDEALRADSCLLADNPNDAP